MLKNFLLFFFLLFAAIGYGQDKSNRGREFWLGYGNNYHFTNEAPLNSQNLQLYISTEQAAVVTVSINGTSWTQTIAIPANTVDFSVIIPKSGAADARILSEGLSDRGIHVVSDVPVVVYAHQYRTQLSGATMLMPVETYGYTYYSVNYSQNASNVHDWYSWFFVVASENNTRIEITPSDTTQGGWLPTQTYTVNLNKGEIYNVFGKAVFNGLPSGASKDMTGSKVVSIAGADGQCHPVAVFSGSSGIRLCHGDGGEFMHQQVFPANAWGTRYLTYHTLNNPTTNVNLPNLNIYRVAVQDPTTVVRRNGVQLTGLVNNFYYEFTSTSGDYIESDKPVLVSQYMTNINQCVGSNTTGYGDPEMFYLSPIEQGMKRVLFYNSRNSAIDYNYVNILIPSGGISSLLVDGNPLPASNIIPHPTNPAYSVAVARLLGPGAQHSIASDSTFTATVYGLGIFESYGYNVGCLVNNLNAYSQINNVLNTNGITDTFTCTKTPVRIIAKIAYPATNIRWHLSEVPGMSPSTDSIINAPVPIGTGYINGRQYYYYTLQQDFVFDAPGTYYIPVTYTALNIDNCNKTERTTLKVVVKRGPIADFTYGNALCLQDTVRFTSNITANGFNLVNYTWFFDDATTSNTINAVKKYLTDGPHDVRYRIVADNGCVGDTTKTITILESPVADFADPINICQNDSVYLDDNSGVPTGSITEWHWDFGDGNTIVKTGAQPFYHHYTTAGNYTISLFVKSSNGCFSDTLRKTVTVRANPLASFTHSGNVCLGTAITFTDNSSPVTGNITEWRWNFGNTITDIRTNNTAFNYTYPASGSYVVKLVVAGSNGCVSDTFRRTVVIAEKPVAGFSFSGKACIDSTLRFTSTKTVDLAVPGSWYWDCGDGNTFTTTSTNIATHAYTNAATNITVRHAVSVGGCSSDTVDQIIPAIYTNPVAGFTINTDTLCEKYPIHFTGTASADVTNWSWNFGNGTGNQVPPFKRPYTNAGNYTVNLQVQNSAGCSSAPAAQTIQIAANPPIDAGPDIYLQIGQTKTILATIANPTAYDFTWTPSVFLNDATLLNPLVNADRPMMYKIMAVDKLNHCVAYDSMYVKIVTDIFVPTGFTPNGDGLNDRWDIPALQAYPDAYVAVYNRNGEKVYESSGLFKAWDGTFKGLAQASGVFVYFIKPDRNSGKVLKGTFMLIR